MRGVTDRPNYENNQNWRGWKYVLLIGDIAKIIHSRLLSGPYKGVEAEKIAFQVANEICQTFEKAHFSEQDRLQECKACEDGGWVQVFSHNPPAFDECPDCRNPNGYPSP